VEGGLRGTKAGRHRPRGRLATVRRGQPRFSWGWPAKPGRGFL